MHACWGCPRLNIALLFAWGKPDWKPVLIAYLGLLLQGGCLLAIGTFISTHHQEPDHRRRRHLLRLPAALAVELVHGVFDSGPASQVIAYLSIVTHFDNFAKGLLIDRRMCIFYFSMIFFALFLTSRSMESLRWRS